MPERDRPRGMQERIGVDCRVGEGDGEVVGDAQIRMSDMLNYVVVEQLGGDVSALRA